MHLKRRVAEFNKPRPARPPPRRSLVRNVIHAQRKLSTGSASSPFPSPSFSLPFSYSPLASDPASPLRLRKGFDIRFIQAIARRY
ncbi:MAG: hypothetical protein D6679_03400 [Candidatus Hydrogenedentota bacterium]|nr:MAG: hypothetical protein D6679_03400 [Candidatus Hydrogenedentota bacterium]